MIKTTNIESTPSSGFLVGDFKSLDNFVVVRNDGQIMNSKEILDHDISWKFERPQIALLNVNDILISEMDLSNFSKENNNAWIINSQGVILRNFNIGQANRLLTTEKHIIATYNPNSYAPNQRPEFEIGGLAIFDHQGECQHYLEPILEKHLNFFEIKSIVSFDNDSLYFQTYPDFNILKLNLNNYSLCVEHKFDANRADIIDDFWIPSALTKYEENWFFITSSRETLDSSVFKMNADSQIELIGKCNYAYAPKGLSNGRFFIPSFNYTNTESLSCQLIECKHAE